MNMQILKMVTENQVKTTQESKEKKDNTRSTLKRWQNSDLQIYQNSLSAEMLKLR